MASFSFSRQLLKMAKNFWQFLVIDFFAFCCVYLALVLALAKEVFQILCGLLFIHFACVRCMPQPQQS